jgi:hypothetical protein
MPNKPQRINIQSRTVMDPRINFAAFLPLLVGGMSWCVGVRGQQPQKMESSLSLWLGAIFLPPRLMDFMTSPIISFPSRWTVPSHDESRLLMRLTIACGSCHSTFRTNLRTRVTRRKSSTNKASYRDLIGFEEKHSKATKKKISRRRRIFPLD